jgi:hypothetical protein
VVTYILLSVAGLVVAFSVKPVCRLIAWRLWLQFLREVAIDPAGVDAAVKLMGAAEAFWSPEDQQLPIAAGGDVRPITGAAVRVQPRGGHQAPADPSGAHFLREQTQTSWRPPAGPPAQ